MSANLVFVKKDGDYRSIAVGEGSMLIGRRHDCDVRLPLATVSRRHCRLEYVDGALTIRDLGSRNGTRLNGEVVEQSEIQAGDHVTVGEANFLIQIDDVPDLGGAGANGAESAANGEETGSDAELEDQTTEQMEAEDGEEVFEEDFDEFGEFSDVNLEDIEREIEGQG